MCDVVKVLERELDNTGLVYIYKEGEHWYAYEQSAFFLSQMLKGQITLGRFIMDGALWLAQAEVDISILPRDYLVSYSATEYVLRYVVDSNFHDWLSEMNQAPA